MPKTGSFAFLALLCLQVAAQEPTELNPIQKVVKLLEEMRTTVNKEADEDKASYDKYKCWCVTNDKEKTEAIANAEAKIEELTAFIEEAAGTEGRLKTEIAGLQADIADDTDALETATAMKEKETAEFEADSAYMKQTLASLKEALAVLSKVQLLQKSHKAAGETAALLQVRSVLQKVAPKFRGVMQKDLMDFLGSLNEQAPGTAAAFLEKQPIEGGGAAAGAKSYNSQSGQIFGVLGAMEDQFKEDLASAEKEESMAIAQFQKLSAAKTSEISAATTQEKMKSAELADTMAQAAQAKEDLEATKTALASDQAFMADLTKNCDLADQEYAGRMKVRNDELLALAETLKIVTGDEARELFEKATLTFLQVDVVNQNQVATQVQVRAQQKRALHTIMRTAVKFKDMALAGMAMRVQIDNFKLMDDILNKMIDKLQGQKQEEYEKLEMCNKEIDTNEDKLKVKNDEKEDLDDKHTELSNHIATLTDDIATLKKDVENMEISLKQAGETRKTENLQFQQSVSDQRATIKILNMALDRLKQFYGFVQVHQAPPRPAGYEQNKNSGGVMQMIAKIITDAEVAEEDFMSTENQAQTDYVAFVADATASIESDRAAIAEKESLLATAESDKSATEESQLANEDARYKLKKLLVSTHRECDFLIKYSDMRQQALQHEIDGINDAKASLHGATLS